jgi:hypothetical protein
MQLLRGKDGTHSTAWSLKAAQELLQESFDPIMDLSTNTDLLPLMLYARQYGEWDYKNVHVMLLRHKVRGAGGCWFAGSLGLIACAGCWIVA